jgi:hypothetical protein
MRSRIAIAVFLIASCWIGNAAATCSQASVASRAAAAAQVRDLLLRQPLGDGMQTSVSEDEQTEILAFKNAVAALVDAVMLCVPVKVKVARLREDLERLLPNPPLPTTEPSQDFDGRYGANLSFQVRRAQSLIGVSITFGIECGADGLLLIYAHHRNWREALRWQSPLYKEVSGGWLAFDYAISPPDRNGRWFVAVKKVAPWCWSTWSGIDYSVLRPTSNPIRPRPILHREDYMWWGNEDYGRIKVDRGTFELRFHGASIDTSLLTREYIRRFRIGGSKAERIPPFADLPRDIADEWIVSSWPGARLLSSDHVAEHERKRHHQLRGEGCCDYQSIRACPRRRVEVEIERRAYHFVERAAANDRVYFLVERAAPFRIEAISSRRFPGCRGANELPDN